MIKSYCASCFLLLSASLVSGGVVTYPAPAGEKLSTDYQVSVNGKPVDVYSARVLDPPFAGKEYDYGGNYSFANFDTDIPVEVRITSERPLRNTQVRPQFQGVAVRVQDEHTLILSMKSPRKLSVEPEGKKGPLLLFANPPERHAPRAGDRGVLYFGPGIHNAGKIALTNGQTLYLAGGAVVKGGIVAEGQNIRIAGRGILDSSDYEWRKGPTPHVISIRGTNVLVEGITVRGASHWTIVPRQSRKVEIRGVKICGSRVQNDDGINPCNSRDVLITGCFIRSDDDCVAMKGLELGPDSNVENVTVEDSTLWCDRARIFLLGHESRAPFMRHIRIRNLDVIHFSMTAFLLEPGEEMRLQDVKVQDVRLHGEGQNEFIRLKPVVNQYMRNKVPGYIFDVQFDNVTIDGQPGRYLVQISGADQTHDVQEVTLEKVVINGDKLAPGSAHLQVGNEVKGLHLGGGAGK